MMYKGIAYDPDSTELYTALIIRTGKGLELTLLDKCFKSAP